jgi:dihydroorotase
MSTSTAIINGVLVAKNHPLNGALVSIRWADGIISEISSQILDADQVIDAQEGFISVGWCDSFAVLPDPGAEWKERLDSFVQASIYAGFTQSAVFAGVDPLPEKATSITALLQRSAHFPLEILPLGAASESCEGKEMAEVYDMHTAGTVAQTDGMRAHGSDGFRAKLIEYAYSLGIPYLVHPFNPKWVAGGQIHEGAVSVNLGLKGIPRIAETSALLADIELAKWLKVPLRVLGVSCKESVDIIKRARLDGVEVWAAVPMMNLCFTEADIANFDARFKVLPPLRTEADRSALRQAVLNGDIQAICSNHTPEDIENKKVEFDYAHYGAATLVDFIARLYTSFSDTEIPLIINALTNGNRDFLGIKSPILAVGEPVNLTVINNSVSHPHNGSIAYNQLPMPSNGGALVCAVRDAHLMINS